MQAENNVNNAQMKIDWKKILPYAVAIVAFVVVAMIYCAPLLEGKVLVQGDVNNWKGAAQEALEPKLVKLHRGPTLCLVVCRPTKSQVVCHQVNFVK